ncbi:aminopeptidase P family protein [Olivibacter sitiensis]|uniref:aminopeptidase P family protein n=1 Tax=Olivibacter sitiensis TaxID=376470 RepID=UPI000685C06B|nr:aminopeptidase P family protein [Olivibacter sitiensis]
MFNTSTYINRRNKLQQSVSDGILLFLGNAESPMNFADNAYHFRQDSTFLYYFGINEPNLSAVMDVETGDCIVFGNEHSMDEIIWMGRLETLSSKAEKSGVTCTKPSSSLSEYLNKALSKGRTVHFLPPYRDGNKIKLHQFLNIPLESVSQYASVPFIKAVVAQRSIKSEEEIAEIENAVNNSVAMHTVAMRMAKSGMNEKQLAAMVQFAAESTGGHLAYPTIMTVNGQILHNHHYHNILQEGQLILNDSGAETAMGYAGDLTRTFPVSGKFTTKQSDVYQIVLNALDIATAALKPGVKYLDIHLLSCKILVAGLKELGLMKGDTEEAVAAGAHTLFFQCGTGHMMGLDVHDMEDLGEQYVGYTDTFKKDTSTFGLKSLRLGKELQTGYVLTVEPGLYFIPELIDLWKAEKKLEAFINYDKVEEYRDFSGIRIEDDVVITADGHRILGQPLAKSISEIEGLRAQKNEFSFNLWPN